MGYYTKYSLQTSLGNNEASEEIIAELRAKYDEAEYALDETGASTYQESKWYDHEENFREFSKLHPKVVFTLSGEGEESGDIWTEYYLNGKCQVAKAEIKVEPFDSKKLK
jgi:hypothetical protein